ncbi:MULTISPECIES: metallophosphoesterase family protein [Culturomica]|jgi:putative phosphoesterase|uniref:metallophosphoesterase family protein n=1 Tax=Culturomica TaxID=1926651 RepID=UPI0003390C5A|nr:MULTISPECIES: metallophosphoesterase family protein [Odoribacteraceae]RHV98600.1 metallophosphoesterase [Odoribacter sp. OF09-27XD]CCZ06538.1 mJ0936 family phosphodiesterase [Odoribacter sp. CAG:788]HBO25901.1 metallophosphoesterase [Culturomica sp.]
MRIGLLSDTHGWLDPKLLEFFEGCDEVWHCGDIGTMEVAEELERHFIVRAVYGNIDGGMMRRVYPETDVFTCEGVKVLMTHIGGYPGHYDMRIKSRLLQERPKLFVCGHSHIAKVMYDRKLACLHINPGAAGRYGFHKVRTAVRFVIGAGEIKDLELIEYERN